MLYSGIFLARLVAAAEHLVDGGVQSCHVTMDVEARRLRLPANPVQPAPAVGIGIRQRDIVLEFRVHAQKLPGRYAVKRADSLESFCGPDGLPNLDCSPLRNRKRIFY